MDDARNCVDAVLSLANNNTMVGEVSSSIVDFAAYWVETRSNYHTLFAKTTASAWCREHLPVLSRHDRDPTRLTSFTCVASKPTPIPSTDPSIDDHILYTKYEWAQPHGTLVVCHLNCRQLIHGKPSREKVRVICQGCKSRCSVDWWKNDNPVTVLSKSNLVAVPYPQAQYPAEWKRGEAQEVKGPKDPDDGYIMKRARAFTGASDPLSPDSVARSTSLPAGPKTTSLPTGSPPISAPTSSVTSWYTNTGLPAHYEKIRNTPPYTFRPLDAGLPTRTLILLQEAGYCQSFLPSPEVVSTAEPLSVASHPPPPQPPVHSNHPSTTMKTRPKALETAGRFPPSETIVRSASLPTASTSARPLPSLLKIRLPASSNRPISPGGPSRLKGVRSATATPPPPSPQEPPEPRKRSLIDIGMGPKERTKGLKKPKNNHK
jgi:hypothetical protein